MGWARAKRQGTRVNQCFKKINRLYNDGKLDEKDIEDLDKLKTGITNAYVRGKISYQHYANLKVRFQFSMKRFTRKKLIHQMVTRYF